MRTIDQTSIHLIRFSSSAFGVVWQEFSFDKVVEFAEQDI